MPGLCILYRRLRTSLRSVMCAPSGYNAPSRFSLAGRGLTNSSKAPQADTWRCKFPVTGFFHNYTHHSITFPPSTKQLEVRSQRATLVSLLPPNTAVLQGAPPSHLSLSQAQSNVHAQGPSRQNSAVRTAPVTAPPGSSSPVPELQTLSAQKRMQSYQAGHSARPRSRRRTYTPASGLLER